MIELEKKVQSDEERKKTIQGFLNNMDNFYHLINQKIIFLVLYYNKI